MRSLSNTAILRTWGRILSGGVPALSIEITRECPLRCPGCYAYDENHLGSMSLRQVSDFRGEELVRRVLQMVDRFRPLHLSLVGGDPLVRYRELEALLPILVKRTYVQVVTSAFRKIPLSWAALPNLRLSVSIDGLQPEHDARRKPATYDRILKNIQGHHVAVHCTITSQMMKRDDYIPEFVDFWAGNPAVEKVWMSMFTPQRGAENPECLSLEQRRRAVQTLLDVRARQPKLDMPEPMIREFLNPPASPARCIFAKTTQCISADLKTRITPCQFGGNPDCSKCGCAASLGMAAVGRQKLLGSVHAGDVFWMSAAVGQRMQSAKQRLYRMFEVSAKVGATSSVSE